MNKLKKKPGIKYEDDNDDNHDDDEKANEKNEKQKTTNELHDEANQCPCVCHGMYALNKEESKKKLVFKIKISSAFVFKIMLNFSY